MEATIQANNQAINIDINVSINVGALKANIQRGLQAIKQSALRAIKQRVLTATKQATKVCCNVGAWSLPRLYRQELRLARTVAAWCDRHNTLVNWLMAIQVMAFALYVFMFV